jgi:hypothetical protein
VGDNFDTDKLTNNSRQITMEFNFKNLNSDLAAQIATYIKLSLKKKKC